jgi:hypothetical protein
MRKRRSPEELAGQLNDTKPIRPGGKHYNNSERKQFVEKHRALYQRWTGLLLRQFIHRNREVIDRMITLEARHGQHGER